METQEAEDIKYGLPEEFIVRTETYFLKNTKPKLEANQKMERKLCKINNYWSNIS